MVYPVKKAAEILCVSSGTVYALVAARKLRASRVGLGRGAIRISDEAIAEYLASREQGATPAKPCAAPVRRMQLRHLSL